MKHKKKQEEQDWGYGSVTYEDCWGLDTKLAGIISEHLHAFLNAEKYSSGAGFPGRLLDQCGQDSEKAMRLWLNIIRKMIYAFENYGQKKYQVEKDEEMQARIKEGMQLFIDFYSDLWI